MIVNILTDRSIDWWSKYIQLPHASQPTIYTTLADINIIIKYYELKQTSFLRQIQHDPGYTLLNIHIPNKNIANMKENSLS